jgi:hypothetical protein
MELTQWILGGLTVLEPVTALTDFLVTAVCIAGFVKFMRIEKPLGNAVTVFAWFFLFMGLGTLFAGLMTHAFSYAFDAETKIHNLPNWLFNVISVTLFEISNIIMAKKYLPNLNTKIYYAVILVESCTVLSMLLYFMSYNVAIGHISFALYIISLPLQIIIYKKHRSNYSKYMIYGILLMLITGPVMAVKFQFSPWFNHNDISHVTIAATMSLFLAAGMCHVRELKTKEKENGIHTL